MFFEITSLYPLFPGTNELDQIGRVHKVRSKDGRGGVEGGGQGAKEKGGCRREEGGREGNRSASFKQTSNRGRGEARKCLEERHDMRRRVVPHTARGSIPEQ